MLTKRSLIVLLVGLNLLLAAVLALGSYSLPSAVAQAAARGRGDFMSVTAMVGGQSYDVLYVVDIANSKLHALYPPNVQTRQLSYGGFRDLKADFGRQ